MLHVKVTTLLLVSILWLGFANCIPEQEEEILKQLFEKYNSGIVPTTRNATTGEESPVKVTVNMYIRAITDIDQVKMQFSTQLTFRNQWNDPRLKFDAKTGRIPYLTLPEYARIWKPDTFFTNERYAHFHTMMKPNVLVRIYPNGDILYSIRVSLTLACPMDHKYYPHTKQTCSIKLASYGYTTDQITYLWKEADPVQITQNLALPGFTLTQFKSDYCTSKTNTGTYSCLKVDILFEHETSRFISQYYLPSAALLLLSWLSFWLPPKGVIARMTLIAVSTALLVMVLSSEQSQLPPVGYSILINQWITGCYIYIIAAVIENVLVSSAQINSGDGGTDGQQTEKWHSKLISRLPRSTSQLDMISRVLFPVTFVIFIVVYWVQVNFKE